MLSNRLSSLWIYIYIFVFVRKRVCNLSALLSYFSEVFFFTKGPFHSNTTCMLVLSFFSFRFIYLRVMYTVYIQMRKHTRKHTYVNLVHHASLYNMNTECFFLLLLFLLHIWYFPAKHAVYDNVFWHSFFACGSQNQCTWHTIHAWIRAIFCFIQFAIE